MKGAWLRVLAVYPLLIPTAFTAAAYFFPTYFFFNQEAGSLTVTITVEQAVAAVGSGLAASAAIFAKWGKK